MSKKAGVPNDIRGKIEAALLCLNEASYAMDAYDLDHAADNLADTCDLLVNIIGDYDIKVTPRLTAIVEKAVAEQS